jgi:hypothetical protein
MTRRSKVTGASSSRLPARHRRDCLCMHLLTLIRTSGVSAMLLFIGACGTDAPRNGSDGERGVVSNEGRDDLLQWTVSPEPVVDLGGREDQALVMVIAGLVRGEEIIVADVGAANLRWFDRAGRAIRTVGERGDGPGQFQFMGWMGLLPGDSLGVWDPALRRLSVFDAEGKLGRMATLHFTRGSLPPVLGMFEDGTLLVGDAGAAAQAAPPGTPWRDTLVYLRVARDGTITDTLGRFPGAEWFTATGPSGRVHSRPFGRQAAAAVHGNRFYVGTGDDYELMAFTGQGTEQARFRRPYQPVTLAARDIDDYQSNSLRVGGTVEERRERAREVRDAPYPRTLPPYIALQTDTHGNVWVREPYQTGDLHQSSRWSVFDPDGRWIATAQGPTRFKVLQIGPDWVLGTQVDAEDVEHVRLYPLIRNAGT